MGRGFAFGFAEPGAFGFGGRVVGVEVAGVVEGLEGRELGLGLAGSAAAFGDAFDGLDGGGEGRREGGGLGVLEELGECEAVVVGDG
ncbi:MAG: hypothetical protein AAF297_08530 [Planctomycetota bacterium]